MKKIKYRVGPNERIGLIPYNATISVFVIQNGDSDNALVYFPSKIKYIYKGEEGLDVGCGSIGFAKLGEDKIWRKSELDYINLPSKHKFKE